MEVEQDPSWLHCHPDTGSKPENRKWDEAVNSPKPAPSDVLPLTRLNLLTVPQLPPKAAQTGDQMFRYMSS